jgi:segregation and condensation protein A
VTEVPVSDAAVDPAGDISVGTAIEAEADVAAVDAGDGADTVDGADDGAGSRSAFHVHLDVYDGPFDLLLSLIAKRRLDVTLVAIAQVTDEFIGYLRAHEDDWDLDQASEFLVVAATLLDLKVARLLPSAEVDEEDLALLEARDLLLARLLQYRAYKEVASLFAEGMQQAAQRYPRSVALEPAFAALLPEVDLGVDAGEFARLAALALAPKPVPVVSVDHIHTQVVSVHEQSAIIAARLRAIGAATFRSLIADCPDMMTIVGRFLALLELYRSGAVAFDQVAPLAELNVRWVADPDTAPTIDADVDDSYDMVTADE